MSSKRGRGRPRLTFEDTVSKILDEGHVKLMNCSKGLHEEVDDSGWGERGMHVWNKKIEKIYCLYSFGVKNHGKI